MVNSDMYVDSNRISGSVAIMKTMSSKCHINTAIMFSLADLCSTMLKSHIPHLSQKGHTALMLAIARGHLEIATDLLQAGADVNIQNEVCH